jgi:thymidylate kinase
MRKSRVYDWDVRKHDFPHYQTVAGGVVGRILRGDTIVISEQVFLAEARREWIRPADVFAALKKQWSRDKAVVIQSVMVADRLEWLPMLVEYAQESNNLLILDRYKMSGVAYGAGDGLEANWVRAVLNCLPDADLNVLLDITVEESKQRRPKRRDFYELDLPKLQIVRETYLREFDELGEPDYLIFDGSKPARDLTHEIVNAIWKKIDVLNRIQ